MTASFLTLCKIQAHHRAILDAAWELLSHDTPSSVRLQDIADRAGVSRQSIYVHFGSRAGLMLELVDHVDRALAIGEHFAPVRSEEDPARALVLVMRLTGHYAPRISDIATAVDHLRHDDADLQEAWEDRMEGRRRSLRRHVSALHDEGRLHPDWTVEEAVDALWAASTPHTYVDLVEERGWSIDRYADWLAHLARSVIVDPA